jgi:hypothetical protein
MDAPCQRPDPQLFWVYARQVDRVRFGSERVGLYPQDIFTKFVRLECLRAKLVPDREALDESSKAEHWVAPFRHLAGKVIGLILCKPTSMNSMLAYLDRQARHVQDYWQSTPFHKLPNLLIEVMAACTLEEPQTAFMGNPGFAPKGIFWKMTRFSANRCLNQLELNSRRPLAAVLEEWSHRFNGGQNFITEGIGPDAAIAMPIPHAMLCTAGAWTTWSFPVATGRQGGGLGLHLVRGWLAGMNIPSQPSEPTDHMYEMSPDFLQGMADVMRAQMAGVADPERVMFHVAWAQNFRTAMLRHRLGLSKRIYNMSQMIHCMVMSGMLAHRSSLHHAIAAGVKAIVQETEVQQYYLNLLSKSHTVPSQTTLYRHRLTIHMAYCKLVQKQISHMLTEGAVARWGTMDSSPQASHNWLMVGFTTMGR